MADQNRGNQLNSDHSAYWKGRGESDLPSQADRSSYAASHPSPTYGKADVDNRANQLNPNNSAYNSSRAGNKK
ncbi:unnamed protein product [Acanthoscelides obtectus]|uniref:Uncharacterized protein n=1 Tax=Acanthoscelides obtectus TaxID=200917 RepID=A0A9P0MEB1_ACAOB|nr:unnamed protein product [Acanthoscelides obtectus]CAK1659454.1 hypothetical protein AOBTE_LOCUS21460 [Acanthoscelides obtectus]